ncbi:MAG: hypothetical protein ACXADC_05335 [Candidatus Thorarchaeota archaeon]
MTDTKTRLKSMVDDNISSIQMMGEKLGMELDDVVSLLNEMINEGMIEGHVTGDGLRFFREKVEVSKAPKIHAEDDVPDFLKYDTRPGKIIALIGFIVVIAGLVVSYSASESQSAFLLNAAALLLLAGVFLMMLGGYQVSRRPAPM